MQKEYKSINKSVRKKDAMQLLTGTPMRCIAPMDVVSKAELRSENTRKKL